jgi:hypothetical protein
MSDNRPFLLPRSFIVLQVLGVVLVALGALSFGGALRRHLIASLPLLASPRVAGLVVLIGMILLGLAVWRLRVALKAWVAQHDPA